MMVTPTKAWCLGTLVSTWKYETWIYLCPTLKLPISWKLDTALFHNCAHKPRPVTWTQSGSREKQVSLNQIYWLRPDNTCSENPEKKLVTFSSPIHYDIRCAMKTKSAHRAVRRTRSIPNRHSTPCETLQAWVKQQAKLFYFGSRTGPVPEYR